MRFENKVAIITGGGGGIGEATCYVFAREGASVVVVDLNDPEKVVSAIIKAGGRAIGLQGSVASAEFMEKVVQTTIEKFGQLDILINNAGIGVPGPIESVSEDDWDNTFAVNVKGGFLASNFALPHLRKTRGTILFTSSVAGIMPGSNMSCYSATKAAVINMAKSMALDHAPEGIRINVVSPGATDTEILRIGMAGDTSGMEGMMPLLKIAQPEEIGQVFAFLASEQAGSMTGQNLVVDNGYTAGDHTMVPSAFVK